MGGNRAVLSMFEGELKHSTCRYCLQCGTKRMAGIISVARCMDSNCTCPTDYGRMGYS
jgi:hypothetical protein